MNEAPSPEPTAKELIFARYIGQYRQADESDATYRKSSEQIAAELSGMESYGIGEITEAMCKFGFKIGFDDSRPVWLMKDADNTDVNRKIEE